MAPCRVIVAGILNYPSKDFIRLQIGKGKRISILFTAFPFLVAACEGSPQLFALGKTT